jgi:hypothetical protein
MLAQETEIREVPDFDAVDSLYREDQFYFSFTYNILQQKDLGISQNKFSAGLSGGFLRDMPINESRTVAIAAGLGYALQNYNYDLVTSEVDGENQYSLIETNSGYDKNKLSLHFVELPIEFRWRTSTFDSHKFWRVYTGVKFSYLFYNRSKYVDGSSSEVVTSNKDLNTFRYGVYLATGYNTWNAYVYYGINPIFKKSAQLDGAPIELRTLNVGLMFYIL